MKQSPVLLGTQRKPRESNVNSDLDDPDEDDVELRYDLREAKEIVIADETHAHKAFGDSIFTAPQEDILEGLYIFIWLATNHDLTALRFLRNFGVQTPELSRCRGVSVDVGNKGIQSCCRYA